MAKRAQLGTNQNAEAIGKDEQLKPAVHVLGRRGMGKGDELSIQDARREATGFGTHTKRLTESRDERTR